MKEIDHKEKDAIDDIYGMSLETGVNPGDTALSTLKNTKDGSTKRAALFVRTRIIISQNHRKNVPLTPTSN
jgi:hypothetical protein